MQKATYTIITFAPVQGFIEKSRKLRDLYGSSYILSLLSWVICQSVKKQGFEVVSPALPNVTQGMPNQIILSGSLTSEQIQEIQQVFLQAWKIVADSCKEWIEENLPEWNYTWHRDWRLWKKYTWEFFSAQGKEGESITQVRQCMNQAKNPRNWTGINWQGESSTLSGSDAIALPSLGQFDPKTYNYQTQRTQVREFFVQLSQALGESFIDPREELSIPELIKRLITHQVIVDKVVNSLEEASILAKKEKDESQKEEDDLQEISQDLNPESFRDLNRQKDEDLKEQKYWTGWFLGDGDSASKYFQTFSKEEEAQKMHEFSTEMREWGKELKEKQREYLENKGRMIYAGGDDFFGVLYDGMKPFRPTDNQAKLAPCECLQLLSRFKSSIWQQPQPKVITASVGFVWAGNQVPQRDVLQHCREAEKAAKNKGRDRIAFRILFNSGNYLEWVCPWWLLDPEVADKCPPSKPAINLIESYRDRNQGNNWTHIYQDVAILTSRHAFKGQQIDIALGLIEIYFCLDWKTIIANPDHWWNRYDNDEMQIFTGILGDPKQFKPNYQESDEARMALNENKKVKEAFNQWVINLANVGFHLTQKND